MIVLDSEIEFFLASQVSLKNTYCFKTDQSSDSKKCQFEGKVNVIFVDELRNSFAKQNV